MGTELKEIAYIKTDFKEKFGIPRQSGRVEELRGTVVFDPEYRDPEALRGIEEFSHLWLIFDFSLSHTEKWSPTVRPPRLGGNKRVGVFASRSPFRPNPLGLSCVRLLKVEKTEEYGHVLIVGGADMLDGTPIYDIKPYLPLDDSCPDAVGGYADEHHAHRLTVDFSQCLLNEIREEKRSALIKCIADDPRPSYINDTERIYKMKFSDYDIAFKVEDGRAKVVGVEKL